MDLVRAIAAVVVLASACTSAAPAIRSPDASSSAVPSAVATPSGPPRSPSSVAVRRGGTEITDVVVARVDHGAQPPRANTIHFVDDTVGFLGGDGWIAKTVDGGRTWQRRYAGTAGVRDFAFVDAAAGWAIGADELLRTRDGGSTWVALGPRAAPLRSVAFTDRQRGWGIARRDPARGGDAGGILLRTSDGGATWGETTIAADSVCFDDARSGWLGTRTEAWVTRDGGEHWRGALRAPVLGESEHWTATVACAGGGRAYAQFVDGAGLGNQAYVTFYTADGGGTWEAVFAQGYMSAAYPTVTAPTGAGSHAAAISVTGAGTATFVGYSPAGIGIASVRGASLAGRFSVRGGQLSPVRSQFLTERRGWVVTEAFVVETFDGGATWKPFYPTRDLVPTRAVSFFDDRNGVGVSRIGEPAALLRTADGGRTWEQVGCAAASGRCVDAQLDYVRGGPLVSFIDDRRGWAAAWQEALETGDGGLSWSVLPLPAEAADPGGTGIGGVVRTGPATGWIAANGKVYRTDDAGRSWTAAPIPSPISNVLACGDAWCWTTTRWVPGPVQLVRYDAASAAVTTLELAREIAVHSPPNALFAERDLVRTASMTSGSQCTDFGLGSCVRMLETGPKGWIEIRIPIPVSYVATLTCTHATTCWLVTGTALYVSRDSGRSWARP